jgi:hypothetical protein
MGADHCIKSGHSSAPSRSKIMPWNGCGRDAVPLAVELWIDLPEFGGYLRNVAKNQFGCKIDSGVDIATFDNSLELPSENLEIVHRIRD